jgi:hypothetical protein
MSALRAKDFTPGVPVALMLRSTEPKMAPDNGFGSAMMFSSSAGPIYLDPDPAREIVDQLQQLAIRPNELIRIIKIKTSHGGHRWHVERPAKIQGDIETAPAAGSDKKTAARTSSAEETNNSNNTEETKRLVEPLQPNGTPVITPQSAKMCAAFMAAVDAIIEVQAYATRRGLGLTFSEESVRAIGLTIYIGEDRR